MKHFEFGTELTGVWRGGSAQTLRGKDAELERPWVKQALCRRSLLRS